VPPDTLRSACSVVLSESQAALHLTPDDVQLLRRVPFLLAFNCMAGLRVLLPFPPGRACGRGRHVEHPQCACMPLGLGGIGWKICYGRSHSPRLQVMALRERGGALAEPAGKEHHVFISHAGEQKYVFVDFLKQDFATRYPDVKVFLDEYSLEPGEGAAEQMHSALIDTFVCKCKPLAVSCVVL
jgi:hypothetical protein